MSASPEDIKKYPHSTAPGSKSVTLKTFDYEEEYGPENNFRPGTWIKPSPMNFLLNAGGMGDYVNYSSAFLWVAQNCPWIHGTAYGDQFILEFLRQILSPYPNWKVGDGREVTMPADLAFTGPELMINGVNVSHQLTNATGAHLMDLGFMYYAGMAAAPEGWTLPRLRSAPKHTVHPAVRELKGKYVVFTPGAIVPVRAVTGKHLNPLIEHVLSRGLIPVFLGKSEFAPDINPHFPDDIHYEKGIDLRNKTSMLQAAAVMEHAACVLGLDNGLLHLAACTEANLIFGYNITSVAHREPRRTWGRLINVALTKEDLACIACQTKGKLVINHTYHYCRYGDNKCVDMLFSGGRFERAIDEMLKVRD